MKRVFCALVFLAALPASAAERARAEIACAPTAKTLVYDCTIRLADGSGRPLDGVAITVGADMPSMPMAHNVRPVRAEPTGAPGEYKARLALEMEGDWALRLRLSGPVEDQIVQRLRFGARSGQQRH